ncbi:MAG: bifunctional UDP-N-acetylglucosamine diphosphorylase/glucosamine-1-phosphate N-acetyltransferase GlmU [Proteobacteria bacterium]|nr:bifunctional UDP-N-acetylglucosamine diphosphorylase/glucosamine-1-phosphate N-acetyltransferase GlmU [Pseudomonadota bacterium]
MPEGDTAAVILAAGMGTRMRSAVPKVLHPLAGRPMIRHLIAALEELGLARIVVVVGPGMEAVAEAAAPHATALQAERLGTAHALMAAREALGEGFADVLVLFGDTPLVTPETLRRLLAARRARPRPALVVLGMRPEHPNEYGRLVTDRRGALTRIVEARDASARERRIGLCNSGAMAVDGARLFDLLVHIGNDNAKGEYYLTDLVAVARARGLRAAAIEGDAGELMGINGRADLAAAEAIVQARLRRAAMEGGASLADPQSVFLSFDTRLGRDVTVGPNVVFGPGVSVGEGATIHAFSHLAGAVVAPGAVVGPYARLRPGARIGAGTHIGNFVEIKNAEVEAGAKVNHLTYVGDARVGEGANVGAGTITCNYDGRAKHRTDIGAGAFIGSNVALVAPVSVGKDAVVGAGSVITKDVAPGALALARPEQVEVRGWAARRRPRKRAKRGRGRG